VVGDKAVAASVNVNGRPGKKWDLGWNGHLKWLAVKLLNGGGSATTESLIVSARSSVLLVPTTSVDTFLQVGP